MRILLDTCTFLWILTDAPQLSPHAREIFTDSSNEVYLSSVSTWEIAIKNALGRLPLPGQPHRFIPAERKRHGIDALPLDEESTLYVPRLPSFHQDPFDRMLVCQAIVQNLTVLTPDDLISQYPVRTAW